MLDVPAASAFPAQCSLVAAGLCDLVQGCVGAITNRLERNR
jgi:hypothetical protein